MIRILSSAAALLLAATGAQAIVGGADEAGPLSQASVMVLSSKGGVCSAVVVAPDALLTAAHCVTGADDHRVHFREAGEPVLIVPAAKAVHPGYEAKALQTGRRSIDLALVRLPEPLPARFATATLSGVNPAKDAAVTVSGYGVARQGDARSTGTFRSASLRVIEPHGPSRILVWAQGTGAGACQGDSGGPIGSGASVLAITSWAGGATGKGCGGLTQGILVGPQRAWIDSTLAKWSRAARWE